MFTSIEGRTAIVTGGSKGIGFGIAKAFADAGANVVIAGRGREALDEAARSLSEGGANISTVVVDVTDPESCRAM